jgi:hypothetical protein
MFTEEQGLSGVADFFLALQYQSAVFVRVTRALRPIRYVITTEMDTYRRVVSQ